MHMYIQFLAVRESEGMEILEKGDDQVPHLSKERRGEKGRVNECNKESEMERWKTKRERGRWRER